MLTEIHYSRFNHHNITASFVRCISTKELGCNTKLLTNILFIMFFYVLFENSRGMLSTSFKLKMSIDEKITFQCMRILYEKETFYQQTQFLMILFYKQKKCLFFRLRKDQKILFTIQLVKLKDWEIFEDYQNLPYDTRV